MIYVKVNEGQLKRLAEAVQSARKKLKPELAGAINQVAKKTRLDMGRDIRKKVAIPKDGVEKPLSVRLAATEGNLSAVVTLKSTPRLGLRHFGAKQDKRGVSYRISKSGGRQRVNGAFLGPKPGAVRVKWKGNAFKRVGKSRLPIVQIKGVSAYGVYKKNDMEGPQLEVIQAELTKQLERRINLNVLRASGLVTT